MSTCNVGKKFIIAYVYCLYARLKIKLFLYLHICCTKWSFLLQCRLSA